MEKEILNYIATQRVGVLAVEMLDGSPHAATVHFAHTENPLVFYFETSNEYRKAEPLLGREKTRTSFVIGTDEVEMKTLQFDGVAELIKPEEQETLEKTYLGKFPEKKAGSKDSDVLFFKFTPTWWRFTDWKAPQGKMILTSNDKKGNHL